MRTLDIYVLRQTLKPLAITLIVALLVLMIERMLRLLDLVLGAQGPIKVVFEILGYLVPHYIGLAVPIALLIGVMAAFNRLSRDGETDAMQCAGISLARQARATFLAALVVTVITGITLGYLKPYGRYAYQSVVFTVSNVAFESLMRAGVFTQIGDTIVMVREVGRAGTFGGVFLHEDKGDGATSTITAREGAVLHQGETMTPMLRLFDGVRLTLSDTAATRPIGGSDPPVGVLRFQQLRTALTEERSPKFRLRGADEREFTLGELWRRRHAPPPGVRSSDMIAELHGRLARTLSVPFLPMLGIPLALGRRRSDYSYGIAAGLLLLILYNQVLDFGENVTETGAIGPLLGLWLPYGLFAAGSAWLFLRASARLPATGGGVLPPLPSLRAAPGSRGTGRR